MSYEGASASGTASSYDHDRDGASDDVNVARRCPHLADGGIDGDDAAIDPRHVLDFGLRTNAGGAHGAGVDEIDPHQDRDHERATM